MISRRKFITGGAALAAYAALPAHSALRLNNLIGFGGRRNVALIDAINSLGLSTDLQLCLDAGDKNSYTSGNKWRDVSGNGNDFFLGSDGATAGEKPTFNGSPGGLSAKEYWSFDGGDFFRYDSANETWMNAIHKNSAQYSIFIIHTAAGEVVSSKGVAGTSGAGGSGKLGFALTAISTAGNNMFFNTSAGAAGSDMNSNASDFRLPEDGTLQTLGLSVDEPAGAGGLLWVKDGVSDSTDNATYSSPSASDASHTMEIAARGDGNSPADADYRLVAFAMWQGSVRTLQNFASLHAALGSRL